MRAAGLWAVIVTAAACSGPNPAFKAPSNWTDGSRDDARRDAGAEAPVNEVAPPPADADTPEAADDTEPSSYPDAAPETSPVDAPEPDIVADPPEVSADLAPDSFVVPAGCGVGRANITGINNADGVVVDRDGVLYFLTDDATHSYVGRTPVNGVPDVKWLRIDLSPTTWGLALDSDRQRLYISVVDGGGALVAFDNIKAMATGRTVVTGIGKANDLAVGPDGTVYYSEQNSRSIYSVGPAGGARRVISQSPLGDSALDQAPAGLGIAPDGNLLVGMEPSGPIYKLILSSGLETSRAPFNSWVGWANALTHDGQGRLYVSTYHDTSPRSVLRLESDGSVTTLTSGGRFSSIAFGRGALDCRDLYVADPFGPMRRVHVTDAL